jgi:hypothetical protein
VFATESGALGAFLCVCGFLVAAVELAAFVFHIDHVLILVCATESGALGAFLCVCGLFVATVELAAFVFHIDHSWLFVCATESGALGAFLCVCGLFVAAVELAFEYHFSDVYENRNPSRVCHVKEYSLLPVHVTHSSEHPFHLKSFTEIYMFRFWVTRL